MSALNATTYSSTRVCFAMARDNFIPRKLATIHRKTRTPHMALLMSGLIMIGMAVTIPLEDVASASSIMFLLLFLLVDVSLIMIRRKIGAQLDYGYKTPLFPLIPIIAIFANLGLAVYLFFYSPTAWYITLAWIGVGLLIYYLYSNRHYIRRKDQWKKYAHLK